MIVKNESEVIVNTLNNLRSYIKFSYWVISDTGSTDSTKELIREALKDIPGELVEHEWRDFAYNRTKALECARGKSDYIFIFDADDSIHGNFKLPKLTADRYNLIFGKHTVYQRPLLLTNKKKNWFVGVLHEYLETENLKTVDTIKGDYYVESGRTGFRSKNPTKYADDAVILKNAFEKETDQRLASRYAFYCAQSYKDSNQIPESIEWYKKCLDLNGWEQEKYYACLQIGTMEQSFEQSQLYLSKSSLYDKDRIEGIVYLVRKLHPIGHHVLVNALYHKFKGYDRSPQNKLFIDMSAYHYELEYCNSISAYYCNDLDSGYFCCRQILLHSKNKHHIQLTLHNLQFYKKFLDKDKKILEIVKNLRETELAPKEIMLAPKDI
jgi:glycosyltransferase involved in cell wall biosynthesis